jgi:transcriptional regulator with XRE-family HTH domain
VIGVTLKNSTPQAPPPGEWLAIGERIVQARNRAGIEQRALAERLGMSTRNLRYIESARTNPIPWIAAVAAATNVDGEWIHHGGLIKPAELAETAKALRESLAAARDATERLQAAAESQQQVALLHLQNQQRLEKFVSLLADRLGLPPEPG